MGVITKKKLGILIYVDNTDKMLEEFFWIYKSWIFSGNYKNSDLVVVCNPEIYDRLPNEQGIVKIPYRPYSETHKEWENYKFINSIACLFGSHLKGLEDQYVYLLRTDADVFLTKHLVDFYPSRPVHGRGLYANPLRSAGGVHENDVWEKIVKFSEKIGYKHNRVYNCGHSLLAPASDVLFFTEEQTKVSKLLKDEFAKTGPGKWPGWYSGVITMYAAEIVANHYFNRFLNNAHLNILDRESYFVGPIDCLTLHIHAIHTEDYFSKKKFREGAYAKKELESLDISKINQYCHYLAASKVGDIKYKVGYPF